MDRIYLAQKSVIIKNIFHDLTDLFTITDLPESIVKVSFVIQDTVAVVSLIPWCNSRECARC